MTRHNGRGMIPVHDRLLITLKRIGARATSVLSESIDQGGWCVMRGSAWFCEHVVFAARNPRRELT